ncbi:GNAT family N-acetyltransferase [Hymenobacter sp. GOD-10R]|uniref:GNAT family N-acetyltransferase n=1 Tax=Hymenobacter sp. GOD-10R TaxID=3093922 RepID=UPI002D7998A1|nr:GNAT family N-acetyltransferase [Hymenobacter sp. GOD-10R]WRQ31801.1 GNAT family N-acetyltransferase [Hymenobacter sp. GOD-10R]
MQTEQVALRPTEQADLTILFHVQQDPEAMYQAAFTPKDHTDQAAYVAKFTRFLLDPTIHTHTILVGETIVGSMAKYKVAGQAEITYWLDRSCWGKGIATTALTTFLTLEKTRPIFGRVAFDNVGSQRVLEKGGFTRVGTDKGFAHARQTEVEEFIYKLL